MGDRARPVDDDDRVGVLHDPFQPVLRAHDRQPQVADQSGEGGQNVLGRLGIERRGGLVQHEHPRLGGQHGADGHPLALARGQGGDRPIAQVGQPEQIEGVLYPATHHVGGQAELLHRPCQLVFDHVGDEAVVHPLGKVADDRGQVAWRGGGRGHAVDGDRPGQHAPGEAGDQPRNRSQQRALARTGRPDHQRQVALRNGQIDAVEHDRGLVVVGEGDVVEADHGVTAGSSFAAPPEKTAQP